MGKKNIEDFDEERFVIEDILFQLDLCKKGYEYSINTEHYEYTNTNIKYENEYMAKPELIKSYKNCKIVKDIYVVNEKFKKYRYLTLSDFLSNKDTYFYIFDNKICYFDDSTNYLMFINTKMFLQPYMYIKDKIKPCTVGDFRSMYSNKIKEDGKEMVEFKGQQYTMFDDEYISISIKNYWIDLMTKHFRIVDKEFDEYCNYWEDRIEKEKWWVDVHTYRYYLKKNEKFIEFCNSFISFDEVYNSLRRYEEVWKNLRNNLWINYEYRLNKENNDDYIVGEDYTFLMLNLIKSIEFLLYKKVKDISDEKDIDEKTMFGKLIDSISMDNIRPELSKNFSKDHFNKFIKDLKYVKDECRNGYFHKDRMDDYSKTTEKYQKAFEVLIEIVILMRDI